MKQLSEKSVWSPKTAPALFSSGHGTRGPGDPPRSGVRARSYALVLAFITAFLLASHGPLFDTPFFWDEGGQFVPASLDILRAGKLIPFTTTPNVHPPLVMAYLAGVWKITGVSIRAARVAMLALAAMGVLFAFLLAIDLARGSPGAPALIAPALLCISPLFFAQAMLVQLDMPAMGATALALLLFLQNRFRDCAIACVVLVLLKETGMAAPLVFAGWLVAEKRPRDAVWFVLPALALAGWLIALKQSTGHLLGNAGFTDYNLFYPLHPARLTFALLRRLYYLFIGSGHFIGTAALVIAWRNMPLLQSRPWRIATTFAAAHVVTVSVLGGAVLERYLLPVLPILYAAFALSLRALLPQPRRIAFAGLAACLLAANFINPIYPFPFENNLAFVNFTQLQSEAAFAVEGTPGIIATSFPMSDALRKPDLGYVDRRRQVVELRDFTEESIVPLIANRPDIILADNTEWDPLHILSSRPAQWIMQRAYGYSPPLAPGRIGEILDMHVARTWRVRGHTMSMLVRGPAKESLSLLR